MRLLPQPKTLKEAVENVINSNKKDGYPPTRFIQATEAGTADDLKAVCERLIVRGETVEYLDKALRRFPTLFTLEDFVARFGKGWGFSDEVISHAKARVNYFDKVAGATSRRSRNRSWALRSSWVRSLGDLSRARKSAHSSTSILVPAGRSRTMFKLG